MTTIDSIIPKYFKIKLVSGLHIGAGKPGLQIGGNDNPIIRHQLTKEPYIPGSSLKGRIRALLEMKKYSNDLETGKNGIGPISKLDHIIARSFGTAKGNSKITGRLIFGDFMMTKQYLKLFLTNEGEFTEMKQENTVPRHDSGNANPRPMERVPSGVEFTGMITLTPISGGEFNITQQELEELLAEGIQFLEETYLGGGGTRGNGKIEMIEILKEEYLSLKQ